MPDLSVELGGRLAPIVDTVMRLLVVPSVVVQVQTKDANWTQAFGPRTIGSTDPVTVADYFRVGSVTKTMVGTVALQLVQEGKLRLDDPVANYLPELSNVFGVTVRQLLDMSSGLFSYTETRAFNRQLDDNPSREWQPDELIDIGLANSPYFGPGDGFRYSNTNTIILAQILEQLMGEKIGPLLSKRVFEPLGLKNTVYPALESVGLPSPSPRGYMYGTNVSALTSPTLPDEDVRAARAGTLLPSDVTNMNPSWIGAAGAVISTAADMATYIRALVGEGKLVGEPLRQQRLESIGTEEQDDPTHMRYGLALAGFGPMIGHDGAIPGFQSFVGHDPARDITIVVLTNLRDGPGGGRPANEIALRIVRELYNP